MLYRSLSKNKFGFSLVEIMIVAAIMAILATMAIPNFNRMRANSYRDQCVSNLKRIATVKEQWSYETGAADTDTPTAAQLDVYIKGGTSELVCTLDSSPTFATSYDINNILNNPECKIDATHVLP